ncbi:MAG: hypothetical protein QUS33_02310 [Dehalococcoidia bacterium]|nr:hypothetical protein [Dehalococcoidia bacterium]
MMRDDKPGNSKIFRHALSETFEAELKKGRYAPLVKAVRTDKDLDMEFRCTYLNIYYKGNSILQLYEDGGVSVHPNIWKHLGLKNKPKPFNNEEAVNAYVELLPALKKAVITQHEESSESLEREYEQLIIRANNFEKANKSEYIMIDRQYAYGLDGSDEKTQEKWDLVAVKWPLKNRSRRLTGNLTLIEVKYDNNNDIQDLSEQVEGYYSCLRQNMRLICDDMKEVLRQKLEIGLVTGLDSAQTNRLRKLNLDTSPESAEIVIYLVDHSPNSPLFARARPKLRKLPFAAQILIARSGFAMWNTSVRPLVRRAR